MDRDMHVAVHPIGLRGTMLSHLKSLEMPYEAFYWRDIRDGKAPIGWDEARQMLHGYDSIGEYSEAPCAIVSPLTHEQMLDAVRELAETTDLPGSR